MLGFSVFINVVLLTIIVISFLSFRKNTKVYEITLKDNQKTIQDLSDSNDTIRQQNNELLDKVFSTEELLKKALDKTKELEEQSVENTNHLIMMSKAALENYNEILEQQYEEIDKEYQNSTDLLKKSYEDLQLSFISDSNKIKEDLDKIKATRAALIKAQLREKEIKEQQEFYCLNIKQSDLDDIKILEKIKKQLHNPRILSMLIWSTYFQKPMTNLCNQVVGTGITTGIYKITNQIDNLCYIGQAVDIAKRFKDHAKCGLGIDTPAANKLYTAMIEDGLWNFSFEVLEECPREELNEKEKYYIQLYQSYEYGYNSNKGINK